jgi:cyanuric acid amidohydrolase
MTVELCRFDVGPNGAMPGLERGILALGASRITKVVLLLRSDGEYTDGSRERCKAAAEAILLSHDLLGRTEAVTIIGCEGASTPFGYAFFDIDGTPDSSGAPRLAIGLAHAPPSSDLDRDTAAAVFQTAAVVEAALADAGLTPEQVALVIVNAPAPASGDLKVRGRHGRAAAALGAGLAIGDLQPADIADAIVGADAPHVTRTQTFTGPTIRNIEVMVIGNKPGNGGSLVACAGMMRDLLDVRSVKRMLRAAGVAFDNDGELVAPDAVRAIIVKSGVSPDGRVLDSPTTIYTSATPPEKHARALLSGTMGALFQSTRVFNTFDPIQQAPIGGGTICCVIDVEAAKARTE